MLSILAVDVRLAISVLSNQVMKSSSVIPRSNGLPGLAWKKVSTAKSGRVDGYIFANAGRKLVITKFDRASYVTQTGHVELICN